MSVYLVGAIEIRDEEEYRKYRVGAAAALAPYEGVELLSVDAANSALGYSALSSLTGVAVAYLVITIPAGLALGVVERRIEVRR